MYPCWALRYRFDATKYTTRAASNPKEKTGRKNGITLKRNCCWGLIAA